MKTSGFDRRKFLQLGGTFAAASTLGPIAMGSELLASTTAFKPSIEEKIRLFSNENPYGPSEKVTEVISKQTSRVNRYASFHEYSTNNLIAAIADSNGIKENQVILGHGSFEILCMLTRAFGSQQGGIIVPGFTFNVTGRYADRIFDHKCLQIPLTSAMDIDLQATKKAITEDTRLVYLCNPNNPTGKILSVNELEKFCKEVSSANCTVAIDEAYIDLVDPEKRPDTIKLLRGDNNVLIIRTFSKAYGLAGLRVGYAMGLPETIELIKNQHYSFGGLISNVGVAAAITALKDDTYIDVYRKKNKEVRSFVEKEFRDRGIAYLPSSTNFILHEVNNVDRYKKELENAKIFPIPGGWSNYPDWCRISIGDLSHMKYYIKTISSMDWLVK